MVKTIAIIDQARNGTTMLTGIYHILGVPMWFKHPNRMTYEDLDLTGSMTYPKEFAREVAKRNEKFDLWGFKQPGAWKYADIFKENLIDPLYLAIFKDPVSLTRRRYKGEVTPFHLERTFELYQWSIDGIIKSELPVTFLGYLDAITQPERFVRRCAELAELEASEAAIRRAVDWITPNKGKATDDYPELKEWM